MCGICGSLSPRGEQPLANDILRRMVSFLRHRGPDDLGLYRDESIALAHVRLSIIDLQGGAQPLPNEDRSVWVIFNGEIFNYPELRAALVKSGHHFRTQTDTEVLVHLYEEKREAMLGDLNGQFAFALWDRKRKQLLLARDRMGIAPLFYARLGHSLLFASEMKAILAHPRFPAELDPYGLDQLFTFWATLPPRTTFKNISELPPGHYALVRDGRLTVKPYWRLAFPDQDGRAEVKPEAYYRERFLELMQDAVRIRLRADVTVASFLSGGLDSSFVSALVKKYFKPDLQTFSVRFADRDYDEGVFQDKVANFLGTAHQAITCSAADIGHIMPQVVWHAEKPLIRTAPAPLYLLAGLVRAHGVKVILTGEGADEVLGGYDLFREAKIRRFWSRNPASKFRPLLFKQLYPYLPNWPRRAPSHLEVFYRASLDATDKKYYSHIPRWDTTAWLKQLFSESLKADLQAYSAVADYEASLPAEFTGWEPLAQAQYIEITTLLSGNLLSSQGDRMVMANSVEARQPFLDHRVVEFCAALPARLKLNGLNEKYLLKKTAGPLLPAEITGRTKQAYRAPDSASFFGGETPAYLDYLLSPENLRKTGYFQPESVGYLMKKCRNGNHPASVRENMAVVGVITTLLADELFVRHRLTEPPGSTGAFENWPGITPTEGRSKHEPLRPMHAA